MTKAVFTLNIDNYAPEICALTRPYLERYAKKIGAELITITERKFPGWPVVYEKLQIHELGRDYDWNFYFDADCLIHPDLFDLSTCLQKDTTLGYANDYAPHRFRYDDYFLRDGRNIGACNWFALASNWCLDLWRPLDDLTCEEAVSRITPINVERKVGIEASHLIDDYALSRNIARFGLKRQTLGPLLKGIGRELEEYFCHIYVLNTIEKKMKNLEETIARWEGSKD